MSETINIHEEYNREVHSSLKEAQEVLVLLTEMQTALAREDSDTLIAREVFPTIQALKEKIAFIGGTEADFGLNSMDRSSGKSFGEEYVLKTVEKAKNILAKLG